VCSLLTPEFLTSRCWRNCTLDGEPCRFKKNWRLPNSGILDFDFLKISKPDADDKRIYAMSDGYFNALIKEISAPEMTQVKIIDVIKTASNNQYFLCKHILKILEFFPVVNKTEFFQPRVELIVIVFGRTIDWLGLTNIYNMFLPFERQMLVRAPLIAQPHVQTMYLNNSSPT
jgi:hypothetical protein